MKEVLLVSSSGGHFKQLYIFLRSLDLKQYEPKIITERNFETVSLLRTHNSVLIQQFKYRNIKSIFSLFFFFLKEIKKTKPSLIVSTGAGIFVPVAVIGHFLNIPMIYIEPIDFVSTQSLTAFLVSKLNVKVLVQHKSHPLWKKNGVTYLKPIV